ncbi:hypothetical protein MRX96_047107 [Rhipicephalus microplus]
MIGVFLARGPEVTRSAPSPPAFHRLARKGACSEVRVRCPERHVATTRHREAPLQRESVWTTRRTFSFVVHVPGSGLVDGCPTGRGTRENGRKEPERANEQLYSAGTS